MRNCALVLGCAALMMAAVFGCSRGGDGGPPRVPVAVTVTHNGSPVQGAHVTFVPKGDGQAAYGVTGADGKTELSTQGERDGAMPGDYQVMVRKTETEGPERQFESTETGAMPAGAEAMKSAQTRNLLPEKYSAIGTTDLQASVAADGKNEFSFDLTN